MNNSIKVAGVSLSIALCSTFSSGAKACVTTPVSELRIAAQRILDNNKKPDEIALTADLTDMWFDMCEADRRQKRYLLVLRPLISRPGVNRYVAVMINDVWRDARFFAFDARKAYAAMRKQFWLPGRPFSVGPDMQNVTFWRCLSARLNSRPIPGTVCDDLDEQSRRAANPAD